MRYAIVLAGLVLLGCGDGDRRALVTGPIDVRCQETDASRDTTVTTTVNVNCPRDSHNDSSKTINPSEE